MFLTIKKQIINNNTKPIMKQHFIQVCMLTAGLAMPTFSASLMAAGNPNPIVAQQQQVQGTVVDKTGEPLIGVTVQVVGQQGGTVTDMDGHYSIKAAKGAQLKFSYIGFTEQTLKVTGNQLNVTMSEDNQTLQEVVVVGYGVQKKESLTGAVTVVDAKAFQDKGSVSSPLQALQGAVPGVVITRNSGAPGDESWGMSLRGAVSTNSASPLVIVDGVEYSDGINGLRLLNSADIESIKFLKDASAAIYGSKAAGGVVLITTKRAKDTKMTIEYSGSFTAKKVGMQPELMSMEQWCDAVETALMNDGGTNTNWLTYVDLARKYKGSYIDLDKSPNPFGSSGFKDVADFVFSDNDWQKTLWGDSWSTQHSLSLSGGNQSNMFRISLGYLYDGSTLQWGNNNNQRFNLRVNDKLQVAKNFTLTTDIAYNRQDQVAPSQIGSVLSAGTPQPGLPASTIDGRPYAWGTWCAPNWIAELGGDNKLRVNAINISEMATWNINKNLDAVVTIGYNTSSASRDNVSKAIDWYNYAGTREVFHKPTQSESSYSSTFSRTDYYMGSGYLNYHTALADKHHISAMVGAQYNYMQYKGSGVSVKDINPELEIPNGQGLVSISGASKYHEAMMSYFSRLNYDYKERYLLEGLMRYDGSSKFQKENRWQFFWGLSGGWRLMEESFMKPLDHIFSNLKLRLSYGVVGNQSGIGRYDGTQLYNVKTASGALIGSGLLTYIDTNGELASTDRTWEKIHNYNVGLDFGFLNNRLTGSVEGFYKRNNNMLISVDYPGILGDKAPKANKGKFEAKGWELNLNWADRIGQVKYHIGGMITYATNKVLDIGATSVISAGFKSVQEGYPLNSYFGYRYMGKIQTQEQLQKYTDYYMSGNTLNWTGSLRLGDNMFEDVNHDGKINEKDLVYLGSDDPKLSYSFNLGAEWKGIDISAMFQGVGRRTIFRDGSATGTNSWRVPMSAIYQNTTTQSIGKTWSPENRDAYYPTYTNTEWLNKYNYQISTWSVEDGAYLRLKNLTIGYTLPQSVIKKLQPLNRLRIYFTGTDLWETSKVRDGWDPEQSRTAYDDHNNPLGRYPFNRTFTIGVDATF